MAHSLLSWHRVGQRVTPVSSDPWHTKVVLPGETEPVFGVVYYAAEEFRPWCARHRKMVFVAK